MARSRKGRILPWMEDLAEKHQIDVETVMAFYDSIGNHNRILNMNKKDRTESFFDLYFEGRNSNE